MLKIWLIVNDCPPYFGKVEILRAYMTREGARKYLKELKSEDSYSNQYMEIIPLNVKAE